MQADQAEGNRMKNFQTQPHAAREGWHAWGLLVFRTKRYQPFVLQNLRHRISSYKNNNAKITAERTPSTHISTAM